MTNTEMTLARALGRSPVEKFYSSFDRDRIDDMELMEVDLGSVRVLVQLGATLANTIVRGSRLSDSEGDNRHLVEVRVFRGPMPRYNDGIDRIFVRVDAARFIGTNVLTVGNDEDGRACFFISSVNEVNKTYRPWWQNRDLEERIGVVRVFSPMRKTATLCNLDQSDINIVLTNRTVSIDIQYPDSGNLFYYWEMMHRYRSLIYNSKLAKNIEFDNGIPARSTYRPDVFYSQAVLMEMIP